MSRPDCSDVCEIIHDRLKDLGFNIDPDDEDHTDVIEALNKTVLIRDGDYCPQCETVCSKVSTMLEAAGFEIDGEHDAEPLSRLSHLDLTNRLTELLDALYSGSYYGRFGEIAEVRGRKIESSHFSRMNTASLQLLIETIESLRASPELREARLTAEEVLRIVSIREGNLFAEDMREFIGRELDLTDAAMLEAWETIEQDRMKKEGCK